MPATAYTLAELRERLAARWEAAPYWTTSDADAALTEACRTWNALTGYWRRRIIAVAPPRDPFVPVSGTLVREAAVTYQGQPVVGPVSLARLGQLAPNWRRDLGATSAAPRIWARVGLGALVVWPAPRTAGVGPVSYEIDGVRQTPSLIQPTDVLDADDALVDLLLGAALHYASFKAGGALLGRTIGGHQRLLQAALERVEALRRTTWARALSAPDVAERIGAQTASAAATPSEPSA